MTHASSELASWLESEDSTSLDVALLDPEDELIVLLYDDEIIELMSEGMLRT